MQGLHIGCCSGTDCSPRPFSVSSSTRIPAQRTQGKTVFNCTYWSSIKFCILVFTLTFWLQTHGSFQVNIIIHLRRRNYYSERCYQNSNMVQEVILSINCKTIFAHQRIRRGHWQALEFIRIGSLSTVCPRAWNSNLWIRKNRASSWGPKFLFCFKRSSAYNKC